LLISYLRNEPLTTAIIDEAERLEWETMDIRFVDREAGFVKEFDADGVLCCHKESFEFLRSLSSRVVVVGYRAWYGENQGVSVVESDHREVGHLAAEHFLERGFSNIGCVNIPIGAGPKGHPTTEIGLALQQDLEAAGVGRPHSLMLDDIGHTNGLKEFEAWIKTIRRPAALLVWQDGVAARICGWCRELGISVPEDLAVLGIGNARPVCKLSACPLSSVETANAKQGAEAARLLHRMMESDEPVGRDITVPPAGVVTRKSTDILAVADAGVAKGLRYIWENLSAPISVDDVAAVAGVSRSTLERHFRQQIGRSVNQELLRKRLEYFRELLLSSDLPVTDLAPRAGFFTRAYLHRAFKEHFGVSPRQLRKQKQTD
jgi:LacI family transcriptional regulator